MRCVITIFAAALLGSFSSAAAQAPPAWTGFYLGANIGTGWGSVDVRDTNGGVTPGPFSYNNTAWIGGLQAGYNHQLGPFVAGVEIDGGYMGLDGDGRIPSSTPPNYQRIWVDGGLYAMATGRLGFAIMQNTLIYGKGGFAWFDGEAGQKTTKPGYQTSMADGFRGAVFGGGVEYMMASHLSFKVEYLHMDLGSVTGYQLSISDPPIGFKYFNTHDFAIDTVRGGLNYKF